MTLEELRFNTRFAWENAFVKWVSFVLAVVLVTASCFAAVRLTQLGLSSGYVVTHYTVYLGIDQIMPLPWLIALIGVPILLIFATIVCGFLFFRQDGLAGYALVALAAFSTVIWILQLYHLIKINS
ncbi:MAG: hypothetical protein PHS79_01965 [Patescibacteria group bacterium]|nr:hypothetical protein [Patescibacteria group bacterium]